MDITGDRYVAVRARAPLRLGFAGGGTDVSPYCDQYGGCVLNATISKYAYATIATGEEPCVMFVAADQGKVWEGAAQPYLEPDRVLDLHKGVYNRIVEQFNDGRPLALTLTTFADAPPGSGLGTSSTLVVAMLKAFVELLNIPLGEYEIAHLAYEIERLDMGMAGGKQDQYAAVFGGFNFMEFYDTDRVIVNPLRVKNWIISELEASTLLFYTGVSRESANIIDEQRSNVQRKECAALEAMHEVKRDAIIMKEALLKGNMNLFARSVNRSWQAKKRTADGISNRLIEQVAEVAMEAGAKAAKVSGAGGGGFMMFLVDPVRRMDVMRALSGLGGEVSNCHFTKYGTQGWRTG